MYRMRILYEEVAEGHTFNELVDDWTCPVCSASKKYFKGRIK